MDFGSLSNKQLVDKYNEMVLTAIDLNLPEKWHRTVSRFSSAEAGRQRCEALHLEITRANRPTQGAGTPQGGPGLARLRANANAEQIRAQVVSEQEAAAAEAAKRPLATTQASTAAKPGIPDPAPARKPAAKKPVGGRTPKGRAPSFSDSDRISLNVPRGQDAKTWNPKRGNAAKRFEKYRTAKTVGEYIKAIAKLVPSDNGNNARAQAFRDLNYDANVAKTITVGGK